MIKSRKTIVLALSLLIFSSCSSQEKKIIDGASNNGVEKMKIEFKFYPSSGGNAIYTVNYYDGVLQIKNLEPREAEITKYKKSFTENEVKKIKQAVSELNKRNDIKTEIILDSWRIELIIDGVIYYNKSDVRLKTLPTDIENLLNLLIKGSTVKIDLYGFS